MRKGLVLIFLFLFSFLAFAEKVEVKVAGMTCGMCVKSITAELDALKKCDKIEVSLEKTQATFELKKGVVVKDDEIKAAIKKAGYEAVSIKRTL